jgi:enoyl-CoA hydratase
MTASTPSSNSSAPSVRISKIGEVTIVTLNRAHVRNAVDAATARRLYDAFLAFDADATAKVAVFHGANGHFCAGWDLQAAAQLASAEPHSEPGADPRSPAPLADLDFTANASYLTGAVGPQGPMGPSRMVLSKPVIAAVSGAAVAGGMELALWCDMRVMEEDAYFGVYCRRFGVPLIDGGTVRLPRLIGMGHAMDLILTGRKVEAQEALQMGLCNRVVPHGEALQAALALAAQLCAFPQATMLADRASAYAQWHEDVPHALHQEWQRGKLCLGDGIAGAARFAAGAGRHGKF